MTHDLVVIGGGAGGLGAARAGARRGAATLLVQAGPLGGECTFAGCIPSKALIAAAQRGEDFGTAMKAVQRAIETVAAAESDEVVSRDGVEVLHGWARFRSPRAIEVDGRALAARRVIVASGTMPAVPPIEGLETIDYLTNENLFELDRLPASLAVLGGGSIGCEMAQAFARLGSQVTVVEALDRLLPREEPEASAAVAAAFVDAGIDVQVGTGVLRAESTPPHGEARLHLVDGRIITAERLLVATGRRARIEGMGLEDAGVVTRDGYVVTDDRLASTVPGVFAAGDVTGKLQFTHAADEMGRIAAGNALTPRWRHRRFHTGPIPWVTFTSPEVARVGITEAQAAALGGRVSEVPMSEVDRAITAGETRGFLKLIVGPRPLLRGLAGGRVLGATMVAARAGEVIHEPVLAMRSRMFPARLALTVHAYPTWSAAVQQAAAQLFIEVNGRRARPARRN